MSDIRTVTRKPKVGDVVLSAQGNLYTVQGIYRDGAGPRVAFYDVVDLETGRYPNALNPGEVSVVAAADAARLREQHKAGA